MEPLRIIKLEDATSVERDGTVGKPFCFRCVGGMYQFGGGVHFLEACPPHFKFQGLVVPKADQIRVVPLRGHAPIIPIPRNITLSWDTMTS